MKLLALHSQSEERKDAADGPFYSPECPGQGVVLLTIKMGLLTLINIIKIIPHRQKTPIPADFRPSQVDN